MKLEAAGSCWKQIRAAHNGGGWRFGAAAYGSGGRGRICCAACWSPVRSAGNVRGRRSSGAERGCVQAEARALLLLQCAAEAERRQELGQVCTEPGDVLPGVARYGRVGCIWRRARAKGLCAGPYDGQSCEGYEGFGSELLGFLLCLCGLE
ncbi:hypothetical protein Taro_045950 [Colocasia esculenta]|uniref:Uncharacterized protein n=1 Tax=Colocasia esculenta TaxID=4460 RepID=A0A843WXU0_COLES|nr:hypothetical protein [Colocasia esculenta]